MAVSSEKIADLHVKHLEMLQAIITRLAGQSATLKNYTLTLTTAVCGFAISIGTPIVAMLALLPIIMFGILDAQYLRTERRVRRLYDDVRQEDWASPPTFEIALSTIPAGSIWTALGSWSVAGFYPPLAIGVAAVVAAARLYYGKPF